MLLQAPGAEAACDAQLQRLAAAHGLPAFTSRQLTYTVLQYSCMAATDAMMAAAIQQLEAGAGPAGMRPAAALGSAVAQRLTATAQARSAAARELEPSNPAALCRAAFLAVHLHGTDGDGEALAERAERAARQQGSDWFLASACYVSIMLRCSKMAFLMLESRAIAEAALQQVRHVLPSMCSCAGCGPLSRA